MRRLRQWIPVNDSHEEIVGRLRRRAPVDLVVHVGAHLAEEAPLYRSLGVKKILWIEADPILFNRLKSSLSGPDSWTDHVFVQSLVSSRSGEEVTLYHYSNDGSSNSVYQPTDALLERWPAVRPTGASSVVATSTLRDILSSAGVDPQSYETSLLVIDVQGHELQVLEGATPEIISSFSMICVEVSMQPLYHGAAGGDLVTAWIQQCGFRVGTPIPKVHGDILFLRE